MLTTRSTFRGRRGDYIPDQHWQLNEMWLLTSVMQRQHSKDSLMKMKMKPNNFYSDKNTKFEKTLEEDQQKLKEEWMNFSKVFLLKRIKTEPVKEGVTINWLILTGKVVTCLYYKAVSKFFPPLRKQTNSYFCSSRNARFLSKPCNSPWYPTLF